MPKEQTEWLKALKKVAESHQVDWLVDLEDEMQCLSWLRMQDLKPEEAFYAEWPEFCEGEQP